MFSFHNSSWLRIKMVLSRQDVYNLSFLKAERQRMSRQPSTSVEMVLSSLVHHWSPTTFSSFVLFCKVFLLFPALPIIVLSMWINWNSMATPAQDSSYEDCANILNMRLWFKPSILLERDLFPFLVLDKHKKMVICFFEFCRLFPARFWLAPLRGFRM